MLHWLIFVCLFRGYIRGRFVLLQRHFLMGRAASCTDSVFSLIVIREFNVGEVSVVFCDNQNNNVTTLLWKLLWSK